MKNIVQKLVNQYNSTLAKDFENKLVSLSEELKVSLQTFVDSGWECKLPTNYPGRGSLSLMLTKSFTSPLNESWELGIDLWIPKGTEKQILDCLGDVSWASVPNRVFEVYTTVDTTFCKNDTELLQRLNELSMPRKFIIETKQVMYSVEDLNPVVVRQDYDYFYHDFDENQITVTEV